MDIDVTRGVLGRKRLLVVRFIRGRWNTITDNSEVFVPAKIRNYAKAMSKSTGLDYSKVLKSTPVKNYRDKMWLDK
jgi:hypothetical protein